MGSVARNAHISAAIAGSKKSKMDAVAQQTKATVLALLAPHNKTGEFSRSIRLRSVYGKSGVRDILVESTHPEARNIEFGHMWVTPEGKVIKRVAGIFVFSRAFQIMRK